jgi:hypothetical protein
MSQMLRKRTCDPNRNEGEVRLGTQSPENVLQAPQRHRITRQRHGQAVAARIQNTGRPWKSAIHADTNLGVPTLLMILTPRVVWRHTIGPSPTSRGTQPSPCTPTLPQTAASNLPKHAVCAMESQKACTLFPKHIAGLTEASVCCGGQFDGRSASGQLAHGVYEGSYWQLLRDMDELLKVLTKLAAAPALITVPPLQLPATAPIPSWNDFKPTLQPVPQCAILPELILPHFREPPLPVRSKCSPRASKCNVDAAKTWVDTGRRLAIAKG